MAVDFLIGNRPNKESPRLRVERVDSTAVRTFTILSKYAWGTPFHWYGMKSHICTKETHDSCENCARNWPSKWRAYLHVHEWSAPVDQNCILEMTDDGLEQIFRQMAKRTNLRGSFIQVSKVSASKHSRFRITVMERVADEADLAPEVDPKPVLEMLWKYNENAQKKTK